jgi:hypothetical protein
MRRTLVGVLIGAWAIGTLLAISTLALPHMAPLPETSREARTMRALLGLRTAADRELVVHVIAARCSCTERLFAHLMRRRPFGGADEIVLFVGDDPRKQEAARGAGFRYATVTDGQLQERFALESAPVMFVFDRRDRLRYAGGYFNHPSTVSPLDEDIHGRLIRGEAPPPLPVYGCAVSARLKDQLDPLGIVYR